MRQHSFFKTLRGRRAVAAWGLAGLAAIAALVLLLQPAPEALAKVVVYKSPSCGCCTAWVEHLEANGFAVEVHNRLDMDPIKAELGIPAHLQSCHSAQVAGYLIEGHVPADLIARLLRERPAIGGLAVPGMPMGSPGMEGPRKDDYAVLAFSPGARATVYARR